MNQSETPVMQGVLLFPPHGVIGQFRKTWNPRFCRLYRSSTVGIRRLEIFDDEYEALTHQPPSKILSLDSVVKLTPASQPNVFQVIDRSITHFFGCMSEQQMTDWFDAMRQVAFQETIARETTVEENDLYSVSGDEIFDVRLVQTTASESCGLKPEQYILRLGDEDMKLVYKYQVLFTWPYKHVRKYTRSCGTVSFEAGRKCDSGEGLFQFETEKSEDVYRCMVLKTRATKNVLPSTALTSDTQYADLIFDTPTSFISNSPNANNSNETSDEMPLYASVQKRPTLPTKQVPSIQMQKPNEQFDNFFRTPLRGKTRLNLGDLKVSDRETSDQLKSTRSGDSNSHVARQVGSGPSTFGTDARQIQNSEDTLHDFEDYEPDTHYSDVRTFLISSADQQFIATNMTPVPSSSKREEYDGSYGLFPPSDNVICSSDPDDSVGPIYENINPVVMPANKSRVLPARTNFNSTPSLGARPIAASKNVVPADYSASRQDYKRDHSEKKQDESQC